MDNRIDEGGPAFPIPSGAGDEDERWRRGMSMRDYFAGQALVGLSLDPRTAHEMAKRLDVPPTLMLAKIAYDFADAMLKVREGK